MQLATPDNKWVSVAEACEIAGCTEGWIRYLLREGKLAGIQFNGWTWMIERKGAVALRCTLSARSIGNRESVPARSGKRNKKS